MLVVDLAAAVGATQPQSNVNDVTSKNIPTNTHYYDRYLFVPYYILYALIEYEVPEVVISATIVVLKPIEFLQLSAHTFIACSL